MKKHSQESKMDNSEIAHKLRNPLTTIMGYSQLLIKKLEAKKELSKETSWAQKIFEEGDRLNKMIDEYLKDQNETTP